MTGVPRLGSLVPAEGSSRWSPSIVLQLTVHSAYILIILILWSDRRKRSFPPEPQAEPCKMQSTDLINLGTAAMEANSQYPGDALSASLARP